jgi:hypothetical protein
MAARDGMFRWLIIAQSPFTNIFRYTVLGMLRQPAAGMTADIIQCAKYFGEARFPTGRSHWKVAFSGVINRSACAANKGQKNGNVQCDYGYTTSQVNLL